MSGDTNPYSSSAESAIDSSGAASLAITGWLRFALRTLAAYYVVCSFTLLFGEDWWIGEVPLFALPHIPKSIVFSFTRDWMVETMRALGMSYGSPSPDMMATKPWAFAVVFLTPSVFALGVVGCFRRIWALRKSCVLLVVAATGDATVTIWFEATHGFTMY